MKTAKRPYNRKKIQRIVFKDICCPAQSPINYLFITVIMLVCIAILHVFNIPNPIVLLMIPIVYATYCNGYKGGILSGVLASAYMLYFNLFVIKEPFCIYKSMNIVVAVAAIVLLMGRLKMRDDRNTEALRRHSEEMEHLAATDRLTGLTTRHAFFKKADELYLHSQELGIPISALFVDIDLFKEVNDLYGHRFGDTVLKKVAEVIKSSLRSSDVHCRYGGEEIVVLLANTNLETAQSAARRILENIRGIRFERYPDLRITVSIGISSMEKNMYQSIEELIHSADIAMYKAKEAGRNQIVQYAKEHRTGGRKKL